MTVLEAKYSVAAAGLRQPAFMKRVRNGERSSRCQTLGGFIDAKDPRVLAGVVTHTEANKIAAKYIVSYEIEAGGY